MNNQSPKLPLSTELQSLRLKLKSSSYDNFEECHKLRAEIKKLHFAMARLNRHDKHLKLRRLNNNNNHKQKPRNSKPEVIPPDLYVSEYLQGEQEAAPAREQNNTSLLPVPAGHEERSQSIERRFAMVAERMQQRRRQWLEEQQKKQPWWKFW